MLLSPRHPASFHLVQQRVQSLKLALPELAITLQPFVSLCQRQSLKPPRTSLRVEAPRNQSGTLQHLEMFGNSRLAHRKRLRQLRNRRLTRRQPRQDRPPRRIGQRREGRVQVTGSRRTITTWFHNVKVI